MLKADKLEITNATEALLRDIIDLFLQRKKAKKISDRICRGRAASISSELEDRFASLLEKVLPAEYTVLVDYPISYKGNG